MRKKEADLSQRRARQTWLADYMEVAEFRAMSPEQQRENLVAIHKSNQAEIIRLPKHSIDRKTLGQRQMEIQNQIHAIRPKRSGPKTVPNYFIEVVKEEVSKFQYSRWMEEATKRATANE